MKSNPNIEKINLHARNLHRFRYDFELLTEHTSELKSFVFVNEYGSQTIDFSDPDAVKALNKALLLTYYDIHNWDIPKNYLCPPIPGRADYIHYVADLLAKSNGGKIPIDENVNVLDIGVGANCIYPIIGNHEYGWSFVGSDTDEIALQNIGAIIESNPKLSDFISLQQQTSSRFVFKNIITPEDRFSLTICNPPFHPTQAEANQSTLRKINNLGDSKNKKMTIPTLNFGGQNAELWCEGGELGFITQMIYESAKYPSQCLWFTTLVSKKANLSRIYKLLDNVSAVKIETIEMSQGQKSSRIVAWTFMSEAQHKSWRF